MFVFERNKQFNEQMMRFEYGYHSVVNRFFVIKHTIGRTNTEKLYVISIRCRNLAAYKNHEMNLLLQVGACLCQANTAQPKNSYDTVRHTRGEMMKFGHKPNHDFEVMIACCCLFTLSCVPKPNTKKVEP